MSEKKFHKFKDGRIVILQSVASGKSLRILEDGSVDGRGQDGQWARFKVHVVGPGHVKLQNVGDPNHWLRCHEGKLDGHGSGGPWCEFAVKKVAKNTYVLRSYKEPKWAVGILPDGSAKDPTQVGEGEHARFHVKKVD